MRVGTTEREFGSTCPKWRYVNSDFQSSIMRRRHQFGLQCFASIGVKIPG
jgi:hypothetical protein